MYIEKTSDINIYIQEETIYSRYPIWLGIVEFLIFRINDGISNFDDNNRNQQIQMQAKKFDFKEFLEQLTPKINNYTQIHVIQILESRISFTIRWILTHKHKTYRVNCESSQLQRYFSLLKNHLPLYPIKKLSYSYGQPELAALLSNIVFDEILIDAQQEHMKDVLSVVKGKMRTKKITITQCLNFQQLSAITSYVHLQFPNKDVNLSLKVSHFNFSKALQFVRNWSFSLPQKPSETINHKKHFGYPFPLSKHSQRTERRQQITINFDNTEIFTLRQLDNLGCQLIFKCEIEQVYLREMIEMLVSLNRFASLQIENLDSKSLINLIEIVSHQFQEGYYRIVIGHQIELTSCRMILNTTGLSQGEVQHILELMKLPGHYEFICYSTAEHFPAAYELFKQKPLVKFNFFLPIEELPPFENLLKMMDNHASKLLLKAYSYAGILKKLAQQGYLAVNSIFYSLGDRP